MGRIDFLNFFLEVYIIYIYILFIEGRWALRFNYQGVWSLVEPRFFSITVVITITMHYDTYGSRDLFSFCAAAPPGERAREGGGGDV